MGQVLETIFHDGTSIKTEYDAYGNEIAKTDQAGVTTYYEYDAEDRLTAVVDALGQRMEYQYDEAGNLVYQKDANGHITPFEYDAVGNRLSLTDSVNGVTTYTYNDNDWLLSETIGGVATNYSAGVSASLTSGFAIPFWSNRNIRLKKYAD